MIGTQNLFHSDIQTVASPDCDVLLQHADMYEVILFNDDANSMDHVVMSLVSVFQHTPHLAAKIMLDAHRDGRAIAEVEERELAQLHKDQLQSLGLTVTIEKVG
jgi:ATP-dependent Clp protease adaptor protein ClpS